MMKLYIDAEFDAVKIEGKYQQAVISLGGVLVDESWVVLDTFYTVVRPEFFKTLNPVVKRMTHLSTSEIKQAKNLQKVMQQFYQWLKKYTNNIHEITCYSFGPDDRRTLIHNCKYHNIDETFFSAMVDVQKVISKEIKFDGKPFSDVLSLENIKSVYDIQGEVEHNALNDAKDLLFIHQAYCQGKRQNMTALAKIKERKDEKQQQVLERQKKHRIQMIKQRFKPYHAQVHLLFCPEVIEQLRSLKDQNMFATVRFKDRKIVYQQIDYTYAQLKGILKLDLYADEPIAQFIIESSDFKIEEHCLITYRNASLLESCCICSHQK